MGGGNFVVPVQTVMDFLDNKLSGRIAMPFLISFASIVQQAKLGSFFCFFFLCSSDICATFKLSTRSEGSKSPRDIPHSYNRDFATFNLSV